MVKCRQCLPQNQCLYVTDDDDYYKKQHSENVQRMEESFIEARGMCSPPFPSPMRPRYRGLGTGIVALKRVKANKWVPAYLAAGWWGGIWVYSDKL